MTYDADSEYSKAIDRSLTIESIIALKPAFSRVYLNTLTTDDLHNLEDCLIDENKAVI